MHSNSQPQKRTALRAFTMSVCSGKGGTGKSTMAALIASALGQYDQSVVIVDCDFGVGDVATMANVAINHGSEDLFSGRCIAADAAKQVGPGLWVIGSKPGTQFNTTESSGTVEEAFEDLESNFDVVIYDTAASIDQFTINLLARSDRSLLVTTPRVTSIADTYAQLKFATDSIGSPKTSLIINQAISESEGEQAMIKFSEMTEKFLNLKIEPLAVVATDPQLTHLADNQSLYRQSALSLQGVKNLNKAAKTIQEKEITKPRKLMSLASPARAAFDLKSVAAYDDTEVTVHFSRE